MQEHMLLTGPASVTAPSHPMTLWRVSSLPGSPE